jgi:hypothetical protein
MSETKKNVGFDPIKEDKEGIKAKRVVWSTESLVKAIKGLEGGRKLIANPFYENNTRLLKSDLVYNRSQEEIQEWQRCAHDIIYFVNKYCKLMTPEGIKHIKLRDYQERYLKQVEANQMNIMLSARQAGKTTTSALFMLHYLLFNVDKTALILGNKRDTACDILSKLKSIFYELPYFLKPGVMKWNESDIVLDNGCRAKAEATTDKSGIGMTIHCCLMDEFAHVQKNILDTFYNNLLPVVTAGKGKVIITSTQNGYNLFYRLWQAAKNGDSDYVPFEVTWDMIPEWNPDKHCWEKRDEEWHKKQVANYGSEHAFNSQFGTSFDVTSNTLIDGKIIKKKEMNTKEFVVKEMDILYNNYFFWDPDYDLSNLKNEFICITTDLAEGVSGDYTVSTINKIYMQDEIVCSKTLGYFRCNNKNVSFCATTIRDFCITYLDPLKYVLSIEYNIFGELYIRTLKDLIDGDLTNYMVFNEDNIIKYYKKDNDFLMGIRMTSATKALAVAQFKFMFEKGYINNESMQFLNELTCFCDNKNNGTFQASYGHDDLVMSQMQLVLAMDTPRFKEMTYLMSSCVDVNMNNHQEYDLYNIY